jgi:hypothetical protein
MMDIFFIKTEEKNKKKGTNERMKEKKLEIKNYE